MYSPGDAIIPGIRNVHIAIRVEGDALRGVQLRIHGQAAVTRKAGPRGARDERYGSSGVDLENAVRATEIEIARGIEGNAPRLPHRDASGSGRCGWGGGPRPRPAG